MSTPRAHLGTSAALALVAAATTWVAMLSWSGFTEEPREFLRPLILIGFVVAASGTLARWWRLPGPLVFLLQLVLGAMVTSLFIIGSPLPVGAGWEEMHLAFQSAVDTSNRFAPPVPASAPGVDPLLIAGGLGALLLVDLLACTLRRVPLAGLPLLLVYSVPVSMLGDSLTWWVFALTAVGFLSMLFLHETEQVARWGRPLGDEHAGGAAPFNGQTRALRATAGSIGGVATALAVIVPLAIPTFGVQVFDFGRGAGGDSDISIDNPMADLRRDLRRGDDIPLLDLETRDPDPSYLRISVLNRFSDNEWSSGNRNVPSQNRADGPVPLVGGVDPTLQRQTYDYQVDVADAFRSTWLPTEAPITAIDAAGDWRYDTSTMDFLAGDDDLTTSGISYTMTAAKIDLDVRAMSDAPAAGRDVDAMFTQLPAGLPAIVRTLTNEVAGDAPNRFEQAVALQDWFRTEGGFTYDLGVEEGNGTDDLVRFLTAGDGGRTGYCEQFAAAMAVMARVLNIPSRVAVGFLQPEKLGRNTWEYSAYDLHAWPELYFPGSGWVRFEPTPPGRASNVPAYTSQNVPGEAATEEQTTPRQSEDLPSAGSSIREAPLQPEEQGAAPTVEKSGFPWALALGGLALAALLVLLLLAPRFVRRSRRQRRLTGGPEAAWLELRDTTLDLGLAWPEGRSPRETRDRLVDLFGAPQDDFAPARPRHGADVAPDAVHALDRIVRALEELRYSRGRAAGGSLRAETQTCIEALRDGVTPRARRLADWWPRSVLRREPAPVAPEIGSETTVSAGRTVDHVG